MRVNVDAAPDDPGVKRLALKLKLPRPQALGCLVCVWRECYRRKTVFLAIDDVDAAAEIDGFATAMVAADLAERAKKGANATIQVKLRREPAETVDIVVTAEKDGVRIRGAADRIAFLFVQAERSKLGVEARRNKPKGLPRGQPKGHNPAVNPRVNPLTPDLAPSPPPATKTEREALSHQGSSWSPKDRHRSVAAERGFDLEAVVRVYRAKRKGAESDDDFDVWLEREWPPRARPQAPTAPVQPVQRRPDMEPFVPPKPLTDEERQALAEQLRVAKVQLGHVAVDDGDAA